MVEKIKGLSKREVKIISMLEFAKKYFFTSKDIDKYTKNKTQRYNIIKNLLGKKRIIKVNRSKYYLIPIKAKSGSWVEHPYVIIDEICNGVDYFIGGWGAASYWRLTDQIPFGYSVFTSRRQGKVKILHTKIIFHRTSKARIEKHSVTKKIENHAFKILNKRQTKKWIKQRE